MHRPPAPDRLKSRISAAEARPGKARARSTAAQAAPMHQALFQSISCFSKAQFPDLESIPAVKLYVTRVNA